MSNSNSNSKKIIFLLREFFSHINRSRRKQFYFLLFLMVLASLSEAASLGLIIPFLGVLANPGIILNIPFFNIGFINNAITYQESLLYLTIAFVFFAIFSGGIRLFLVWYTSHLSFAAGADLSLKMYSRVLMMPYISHISQNSSEIINGITNKANNAIINIIIPFLIIISSIMLLISILLTLLFISPQISIISIAGIGVIYFFIGFISKKRLIRNGKNIAKESTRVIKYLQEGLGGIRDVIIDGTQDKFIDEYRKADFILRYSQGDNYFLSQSPRFAMEALGMVMIAAIAYFMSLSSEGVGAAIPVLGALALGAQRALPLLQRVFVGWSSLHGNLASLQDILELLGEANQVGSVGKNVIPINFTKNISLVNASFAYPDNEKMVLKNISIEINKGERVGVIGSTGSGKSTLLDTMMGLLHPSSGFLLVDGVEINKNNLKNWQKRIAHVPQNIYLADASVAENIAFGTPIDKIDYERIINAAKGAQIVDLINSWPNKFETIMGERGSKISGGQMQRIGIARALYKNADIIFFDEATSALDVETESYVMQAIENIGRNFTIIIIAHRLTTLIGCSRVIKLDDGQIVQEGSYLEVVKGMYKH